MIDKIDLRCGNWVRCADTDDMTDEYRGKTVQIDEEDMVALFSGNGTFDPIELSPAILEAAGFVAEDPQYGEAWRLPDSKFIVRRVNYNKGFEAPDYGYAIELSTEKDWATIIDRCHHLHTLQNFFALTQTELPITLP